LLLIKYVIVDSFHNNSFFELIVLINMLITRMSQSLVFQLPDNDRYALYMINYFIVTENSCANYYNY